MNKLIDQIETQYNIRESEEKWQNFWLEKQTYQWDKLSPRDKTFVIDTPPPTVSGFLHMGHVFSFTHIDFIARFQRMMGKNVFFPIGFDDNGLPTERLVEQIKKIKAVNCSRQEFIEICKEVVTDAENDFRDLFKSLALSVDWSLEYQTISSHCRKMSQLSFLDLIDKDRAYKQMQPSLWDPVDRTALAQADVVDKELPGMMNEISFTVEGKEVITIATTRPELIPACVAVFYHPDDKRYQHLKGKMAHTALFNCHVPILADSQVDIEKGTGLVMCCTFGDITDVAWWRSHKLPARVILNPKGQLTNMEEMGQGNWPATDIDKAKSYTQQLEGLYVKEARAKILEILRAENLLTKQTEITHNVKCAERSGAPLELLLTSQWFIKILDLKEKLLQRSEECNWHPHFMKARLDNWINGLNFDWCISRQRFFGVPFPVWYSKRPGEEGKILVASKDQLPVDPFVDLPKGYSKEEVEPDTDVMDTWATSSISPQLNSYGINQEYAIDLDRHRQLFPADLRPQAHEIIRTWAFYTIVKAELHEQVIPWKNLMISGWCLAADKTKMSKSKGNVVTPQNLLEEKGVDTIRYWASTAKLGADTAYSEDLFVIGKKLVNKLWNASKFAAIHLSKLETPPAKANIAYQQKTIYESLDLWILSRLHEVVVKATEEFNSFEYCNARIAVEHFFWADFCDNYLEFVKNRSYNEAGDNNAGQLSAITTIYHVLETLLKLFAPIMPHITEEIYQLVYAHKIAANSSIHAVGNWPTPEELPHTLESIKIGQACVGILDVVRKFKAERKLSPKSTIKELKITRNNQQEIFARELIEPATKDLANVTNSEIITLVENAIGDDNYLTTDDGLFKVLITL